MATFTTLPSGSIQAKVRVPGQPRKTRTFRTRREAERWVRTVEREHSRRTPVAAPQPVQVDITLADALDRYERCPIRQQKKGVKQDNHRIKMWKRSPLAKLTLRQIAAGSHLVEYRDDRMREGKAPSTICHALSVLSKVYKRAKSKWGVRDCPNPLADLERPKGRRGRERRLSQNEAERLAGAIRAHAELDVLVTLALETSRRQGEIIGLEWPRISLEAGSFFLEDTKNGEGQQVVLSPRAVEALKRAPSYLRAQAEGVDPIGRLFELTAPGLDKAWQRARAKAGLRDFKFHDLRHEACSRFIEVYKLPVGVAMLQSGHKTFSAFRRYMNIQDRDQIAEAFRLAQLPAQAIAAE